ESPPVVAVRQLGKGRIVCYPLCHLYAGVNYLNPIWPDFVEAKGDRAAGRPSDSMKLQMNACRWAGEPALSATNLGTYVKQPYKPVEFPANVDWDAIPFKPTSGRGIRGIFGLHSSYSDGQGTVAEYAQAAKAAGLAFIVFNDLLEKLTEAKLNQLLADCAAVSTNDFYACPGIEFTDGIGNRWALWGERVRFPPASVKEGNREYVQWDGKVVRHYGYFVASTCNYSPGGLLDYRELRKNGGHPENLWAFQYYLPFVYDRDKQIADNMSDYLFGLRNMIWSAVASFTRIQTPADVGLAAKTCFTCMKDIPSAKKALNTQYNAYWYARPARLYVSQGPEILDWQAINDQMESNWRYTRGAQRARLRFSVGSGTGIAEVRIHDADQGVIRRYSGQGAKELTREFEIPHDQQHYLALEVIDTEGRRAISHDIRVYCYKAGINRCGDNVNTLDYTAMCWLPDRGDDNGNLNAAKDFRNGFAHALRGYDTSSHAFGVPGPGARLMEQIQLKEAGGWTPEFAKTKTLMGRLLDMGVNSYNIQIATMRMTKHSEAYQTETRPTPYMASPPRDVMDLEYFDRTHTLYAPMERADGYIYGNHRRMREGHKDYRGGILWHEGEIRFKKDCTLQGAVPIPLFEGRMPRDLTKNIGTTLIVTDADGATRVGMTGSMKGRVKPGGYGALMPAPLGYHGVLVPVDMDFAYEGGWTPTYGTMTIGMGREGQVVKAGSVLKYRFGVGTFADEAAGNALLEHTVKAMNLDGGRAGYPIDMKTGTLEDAVFFFTVRAVGNEAAFRLGPQRLLIDLPIRVRGLADNSCAAIYCDKRPWFRFVPVDAEGTAWLQEDIDNANNIWVGNVFTCPERDVKISLVADGQAEGKPPFIEAHNPTDKEVTAVISSPPIRPFLADCRPP
ncbi:MAG: hypothetical protein PHR35_22885, partial [Kiritimatiellae bacterium]|nr:hypothetical protein [Kiritimatiellia bacterium]